MCLFRAPVHYYGTVRRATDIVATVRRRQVADECEKVFGGEYGVAIAALAPVVV